MGCNVMCRRSSRLNVRCRKRWNTRRLPPSSTCFCLKTELGVKVSKNAATLIPSIESSVKRRNRVYKARGGVPTKINTITSRVLPNIWKIKVFSKGERLSTSEPIPVSVPIPIFAINNFRSRFRFRPLKVWGVRFRV